ncbi:MAG: hypothetical protein EPN14_02000 [Gallionella sp.]|nr:MAG: hypothetical protein EPN14_02000 [Gallionella sp.]
MIGLPGFFIHANPLTGFVRGRHHICLSSQVLVVPFFVFNRGVTVSRLEKSDNELELLRTALSLDRALFTVQRRTLRSKGHVRVDCFASKGAGSQGLTRITGLAASALKYHRNVRWLTMSNGEGVDRHLVVALSKKLESDLERESLNANKHCYPMPFAIERS